MRKSFGKSAKEKGDKRVFSDGLLKTAVLIMATVTPQPYH